MECRNAGGREGPAADAAAAPGGRGRGEGL